MERKKRMADLKKDEKERIFQEELTKLQARDTFETKDIMKRNILKIHSDRVKYIDTQNNQMKDWLSLIIYSSLGILAIAFPIINEKGLIHHYKTIYISILILFLNAIWNLWIIKRRFEKDSIIFTMLNIYQKNAERKQVFLESNPTAEKFTEFCKEEDIRCKKALPENPKMQRPDITYDLIFLFFILGIMLFISSLLPFDIINVLVFPFIICVLYVLFVYFDVNKIKTIHKKENEYLNVEVQRLLETGLV